MNTVITELLYELECVRFAELQMSKKLVFGSVNTQMSEGMARSSVLSVIKIRLLSRLGMVHLDFGPIKVCVVLGGIGVCTVSKLVFRTSKGGRMRVLCGA